MGGPFRTVALELHERGLIVIPTGGEDGKLPLVRWRGWSVQHAESIAALGRRFPDANIGILTEPSHVTVIDADDANALEQAEKRFGPTPVMTRTPRGGGHLWYRTSGERSTNLRQFGLNIDIKGKGGMVLVPPSTRCGVGQYRFERGSWDDLPHLPNLVSTDLPQSNRKPSTSVCGQAVAGERNNRLFLTLRYIALHCTSLDDLLGEAHAANSQFSPPLPSSEAEKVANSVWKIKIEGRLILPATPKVVLDSRYLDLLNADGLYLYARIKRWHGSPTGKLFALSPKAMRKRNVLEGWGVKRYVLAITELLRTGAIVLVHRGGARKGDASQYCLGSPMRTQCN